MSGEREIDQTIREPGPLGFTALRTGTRLGDRFIVDHVIAAGGFGITYGARHDGLGRVFAIKEHFPRQFAYRDGATSEVRPTDPATYSWALDRFLQEGRSLAKCKHPNVVDVTDVFEANGTAYMVLVYEEGQSLKGWLERLGRPPTQPEIDALLGPLLDALAFVHAQGLLHRDIAPDNIMVRNGGTPCLIDFGAARQALAQHSQVMSAIVKSGFSPPEQYSSTGKAQGPWSDIYALGATLYKAVTSKVPPEATERVSEDTLQPTAEAAPSPGLYRPAFLAAIDASLRLRQADRPQSVKAWRTMLSGEGPAATSRLLDTNQLEPRPVPRPAATSAPKSARRIGLLAGLVITVAATLAGAAYYTRVIVPAQLEAEARRRADEVVARVRLARLREQIGSATTLAELDVIVAAEPALANEIDERKVQLRAQFAASEKQKAEEGRRRELAEARRRDEEVEQQRLASVRAQDEARQRIDAEARRREAATAPLVGQPTVAEMRAPIDNLFRAWNALDIERYMNQWASDGVKVDLTKGTRLSRAALQADRAQLFGRLSGASANFKAGLREFRDGAGFFDVSYSLSLRYKTGRTFAENACERYRVERRGSRWLIVLNEDYAPCR